jgi:hypothetical protein
MQGTLRNAIALWVVGCVTIATATAAEKSAAQLLPASVVAYLEVPRPAELASRVIDHPLAKQIERHPDYQKYLASPQYKQYQEAVALIEDKLGMKLRPALETLTAEGIYLGGDIATQGVVVLVRSKDAACTEKALNAAIELAREHAKSEGRADPVQVTDEQGTRVYRMDQVRIAAHDRWLIATNKDLLLGVVLTNATTDDPPSLAGDSQFSKVYGERRPNLAAWGYVDLRLVKAAGLLKPLLGRKSDNPVLELLAGGIVGALPDAPYVTAAIDALPSKLSFTFSVPADAAKIAKQRDFFVGPDGQGVAPPLLTTQQTIFSLSTYRDFASLWRRAPDLFNEEVNAKFAEAETGLSTLFSGRNFRDEILGNLEPGLQLVVARQEYKDVTPALKLPAGAMVVRMKNPQETARIFKITFQSAIGFLNVVGGMNGVDPLDANAEKQGDLTIVAAEYLPPKDPATRSAAPPQYNASPTAVFVGDKFILSSTKALALELAEMVRKAEPGEKQVNTTMTLNTDALHAILRDNRDPLIAQNMLEKGHDRAAAEKEVGGILDAINVVKSTSLNLLNTGKQLTLTWDVELK